jgi:hypothetical protein
MTRPQLRISTVGWAWAAGWALAAAGLAISDVYSTPNRGMLAAYSFGIAGWIIGAAGTSRYLRRCGSTPSVVVFCAAGWSAGALVAVLLGQAWLADWRLGYWGPIVSAALGGSVGGAFTLHVESESAVSQRLQSALRWGASFLFFQAVAFYVGYILLQMTITARAHRWARDCRSRRVGSPSRVRRFLRSTVSIESSTAQRGGLTPCSRRRRMQAFGAAAVEAQSLAGLNQLDGANNRVVDLCVRRQ